MASSLDSAAVFEARALEIGVTPQELEVMRSRNYNSFGKFSFATNFVPGQADETPLVRLARIITGTTEGTEVPDDRMPVTRRLFYESYTIASADIRAWTERRDDDAPRRLAAPERASRYDEQAARLAAGAVIVGESESSHALVDLVQNMYEDSQLRYVRWEQCIIGIRSLWG